MDLAITDLVAYPFLAEASAHIRQLGVGIPELATDRAYDRVRSRGHDRVLQALDRHDIQVPAITDANDATTELLAYIVSRILVSAVGDRFLVRRYAISEAHRIARSLEGEEADRLLQLGERLEMAAAEEDGKLAVPFPAYLQATGSLRAPEWKLINMDLKDGRVLLEPRKFARVLEEVLRRRYENELPIRVGEDVQEGFKTQIAELNRLLAQHRKDHGAEDLGAVDPDLFPPCMKAIVRDIQASANVPHMGRFAIVSFLHTLGQNSDDILKFFATVPDFDVEKSRYQIEHISGKISGTEYTPPSCSTMKTHGICPGEDDLCAQDWMNHPLTYYRSKARAKVRQKGRQAPRPAKPPTPTVRPEEAAQATSGPETTVPVPSGGVRGAKEGPA